MSYNIDSIETVHSKDFFAGEQFKRFVAEFDGGDIPEDCVLDHGFDFSSGFVWCGEWSGHTYDLCKEVLATFDGEADLVLTWEGGDSFSGLRLRNHVVTEHEVVMTLGAEKKR